MPASRFTAMASEISGLSPPAVVTQALMASKAASEAITEPKPTRLAVLKIGSSEALAPLSSEAVSCCSRGQLSAISTRMESTRAAITDHTPRTDSILVAP